MQVRGTPSEVHSKFVPVITFLAFAIIGGQFPANAQNTGTARGQVTDPSGAVVPNAQIQFSGNGATQSAKSNAEGRYSITLPTGQYTVQANAPGFSSAQQQIISLTPGQAVTVNIPLQITTATQQVQVTEQSAGQVSVDPSQNAGALVLKDEDLNDLPDDPDDLQSDLEALAGTAAGPSGPQFFIDGFSGGQLPPKSSIREIRINSNPFAPEFDTPGFGRIEIFTKPGTDKFHGMAFMTLGDRIFDSRNPLIIGPQPGYSSKFFSGNLTGPLGKKASFFLDFNRRDIDEGVLIDAQALTPALTQALVNGSFPTPQRFWVISPRLDYQLTKNNTLTLRYNHTQNSTVGGVGGFSLPTQQTDQIQKNNTIQATETAVLGTKAVDETRFQMFYSNVDQTGVGNFAIPGINVSSSFNSGGAPFQFNYSDTRNYEGQNILTLTEGKHTMKVGGRLRQSDLYTQSTTNFNGSWTFGEPVQPAAGTWCLAGYTNPTSLDLYQQTEILLSQGVPISTVLSEGCGPTQFTLNAGIPMQAVRQLDLGLFAQDDWRARPNLTISYGLRYETQNNISDHLDFGPRFAVAWAPWQKGTQAGKTVIRAGWGRFFTRFPLGDTLNALRYNGTAQQNYVLDNPLTSGGSLAALSALEAYPGVPPLSSLTLQTQGIYEISSQLHAPYMMQTAVGVDRSLPWRTTLSVNFVDTRGVHVLRENDINAYLPGTYTGAGTGVRPYPISDDLYLYESDGLFKQMQVMVNVNSRINSFLSLQGYYVYGQAHTNAGGGFVMNPYDANEDWGRSPYDARNRAFFGGSIGLPLKWVLAPFVTASSGLPFNITTGNAFDADGIFNARPAFATTASNPRDVYHTRWGVFDADPVPGETLIPFDYGQGPAQFSVNFRLSRTWGFGERTTSTGRPQGGGGGRGGGGGFGRGGGGGGFSGGPRGAFGFGSNAGTGRKYNLTFTLSVRNAFNHVNYGPPNGVLTSPFFGTSTTLSNGGLPGGGGTMFGGAGSAAGDRRVELQLRLQF